jgi:hypothetical protein
MRLILTIFLFYLIFSFEIELPTLQAVLFHNDFSREGVLTWLVYSIILNLFLMSIGFLAVQYVKEKFIKKVFIALIIDAIISILRFTIFSFDEPFFIAPLCNAIPLGYVIYCYSVYGKLD